MKLKITDIKFDLSHETISKQQADELENRVKDKVWVVETEDDLADAISDQTGWCVLSINYKENGQ